MVNQDNIALYTNPEHNVWVGPSPPPSEPSPDSVVVAMKKIGFCGSDVHFALEGRVGDSMVVRGDHILGHEGAGIVVSVGSAVEDLKPGDRVAIEPGEACGKCSNCTHGFYNGCPKVEFKSTPPYAGIMQRYIVHPGRLCHKIGDMSYEEGALLEPVSVGLAGIKQADLRLGDPVFIAGAGPIGLVCAILARAAGASPIVISDMEAGRLEFAKKVVKNIRTVQVERGMSAQDVAAKVISAGDDVRPRICLECTGAQPSIQAAIYALDFRGICEVIGVGHDFVTIPFMHQSVNEIEIRTLFRYANTWPRAIRLVNDGHINVKPLVSHVFPLEEGVKAFNTAKDRSSGAIKVMVSLD